MAGAPIGNTNGAKKNRRWSEALSRAIAQDDGERLRLAAESLLTSAAGGDLGAIRELADRLDGKAAQSVTVAGDPDAPLETKMEVVLVSASRDTPKP